MSEDYSFLTQPKETQELFRERFKRNLLETINLIDLDAPNIIIMNQFWIAIRAAIGLAPREFFQHLAQDTLKKINPASGVCADCRQNMHKFPGYKNTWEVCPNCENNWKEIEKEAEDSGDGL